MTSYKMRSSSTADVKEAANGNEDKCSKEVDCGAACDLHHCDFVFGHYCEVVKCACCYFKYVSNDICGGFDASVYSAASKRVCLVKAERLVFLMYVRFLLGLHFVLWFGSLKLTTVASSTIIIALQPMVSLLGGFLIFRERTTKSAIFTMCAAIVGALMIGWGISDIAKTPL